MTVCNSGSESVWYQGACTTLNCIRVYYSSFSFAAFGTGICPTVRCNSATNLRARQRDPTLEKHREHTT